VLGLVLDYIPTNINPIFDGLRREVLLPSPADIYGLVHNVPLPFDHFFFCFLAPAAAGAMFAIMCSW
jgi:hypothetical protein